MRHLVVLLFVAGCNATTTELRVHDPHLIEVHAITERDDVPLPLSSAADTSKVPGGRCGWRDAMGFPHLCFAGRFEVRDGALFADTVPRVVGGEVHLRLQARSPWGRKRPRSSYTGLSLDFVTPVSNVVSLTTR